MPLTKKGKSIRSSMRKFYGSKKLADRVFYASARGKKIKGVERKNSSRRKK